MYAKNVLSIIIGIFLLVQSGVSQNPVCLPDSTYADSLAGVYPKPFHADSIPYGGLKDTACLNHPFELVLTAVVKDSITWQGYRLLLNHLLIEENGVLNLPEGLGYACNPPNCKFESNTMGCMVISGTPLVTDTLGTYDLRLKSEIKVANGIFTIHDTLPGALLEGSHYYLELEGEDSDNCQELSTNRIRDFGFNVSLMENPVHQQIILKIRSDRPPKMSVDIFDMSGNKLVELKEGICFDDILNINIDGLDNGVYLLIASTQEKRIPLRFVVINH